MLKPEGIRNIIFDLGGVLLNLDYPGMYAEFERCGIRKMPDTREMGLFHRYEKGMVTTSFFLNELNRMTGFTSDEKSLARAWNALLGDFPPIRYRLLQELGKTYRVFLLSNINELHVSGFESIFRNTFGGAGPGSLFENIYYSNLLNLRKPEPEIFRLVMEKNALLPEETLFIDDTSEHIESASSLGINTLHLDLTKGMKTETVFNFH